jgi:NAD+ kinase
MRCSFTFRHPSECVIQRPIDVKIEIRSQWAEACLPVGRDLHVCGPFPIFAFMIAAIYGRGITSNRSPSIQELFHKLSASGIEMMIFGPLYDYIKDFIRITGRFTQFNSHEEISNAGLLISLGGDGTLLDTIELIRDSNLPVMGINTGRLGFLSSISTEEIHFAVETIAAGRFLLDKRTMLQLDSAVNLFGDVNRALNDITVSKSDSSSMLTIHAYLNDEYLNSYYADGLIVSTPTGSTAYSLSCGGPIVMPNSENFVITPVAPHNLNVRPIIISDSSILRLKVESRSPRFLITLDSRSLSADSGTEFLVRRSAAAMNIVKLENHDFLTTLRGKLMWGLDKRT